jgi:hypothetical protein
VGQPIVAAAAFQAALFATRPPPEFRFPGGVCFSLLSHLDWVKIAYESLIEVTQATFRHLQTILDNTEGTGDQHS